MIEDAKLQGKEQSKKLIQQAEAEAVKTAESFKKECQEQVEHLRKISADKMNKAVDMILERIVKVHGNS